MWLVQVDESGRVSRFVDDVHFGPALPGESLGRADGGGARPAPLAGLTLPGPNSAPRIGPVLISEIHYKPADPAVAALTIDPQLARGDLEFIEIYNPGPLPVDLGEWQLRGGVELAFEEGTQIGVGEVLAAISFDPGRAENANRLAAFRTHYGIDEMVRLVGGYSGRLSNSGDMIQLMRVASAAGNEASPSVFVLEDEVIYDDLAPWPTDADGSGGSLTRQSVNALGNVATSWDAHSPTPGSADLVLAGDMDFDGDVDFDDIASFVLGLNDREAAGRNTE